MSRNNNNNHFETVLLTGATTGIGHSLAHCLASMGYSLLLVARNHEKLEAVKKELAEKYGVPVTVLECDLAHQDSAARVTFFLDENSLVPDILINNAGAGVYGPFGRTDEKAELDVINLNVITTTLLAKTMARRMNARGGGRIMFVSSTLAFRKGPRWAVYAAAKSFVLSLAGSLEMEFRNSSVKISVLCPGKTDTEFDIHAGAGATSSDGKDSPDEVAAYAVKQLLRGKSLIIPGVKNKLKYFVFRYLPAFVGDYIVGKL